MFMHDWFATLMRGLCFIYVIAVLGGFVFLFLLSPAFLVWKGSAVFGSVRGPLPCQILTSQFLSFETCGGPKMMQGDVLFFLVGEGNSNSLCYVSPGNSQSCVWCTWQQAFLPFQLQLFCCDLPNANAENLWSGSTLKKCQLMW